MNLCKESLFMIQWSFLLFKLSAAIRSKCVNEYCFVSSYPGGGVQTDAQNWCQSNQSKLIEVSNSSIQTAMASFLNDFNSEIVNNILFTNGRRFSQVWSRVNRNGIGSLTIRNELSQSYSYVYLTRSDRITLQAGRSDELRQGYICEGESNCSVDGYKLRPWCYRSYRATVTWYESRNRCLANGGDLASFSSITTDEGLSDINDPWLQQDATYWIGIRKETWKWQSTNSEMVYSNWMHRHPVNYDGAAFDCICILPNSNWQWTECRCTDSYPFICISASSAIASTTTSSTTTTTTKTTTSALDTKATIIITKTSTTDDTSDEGQENIAPLYSTEAISWTALVPAPNAGGPDKSQSAHSGDSLDTRVAIGIGVGVGAGIILIAGIIIIVLVIFKKGCPKRKTEKNMTNQQTPLQPPDIIAHQTVEKDKIPDENPYVTVLRHSKNEKMDSIEKEKADAIQNIIYCELQFMTKTETSELHSNESINLVSEISGPTESLSHPPLVEENIEEPKETDCNDKLRDSVTKA